MDFKHRYGAVECALDEDGTVYARYAAPVRQGTFGGLFDTVEGVLPKTEYAQTVDDTGPMLAVVKERELCVYQRVEYDVEERQYLWERVNGPRAEGDPPFNPEVLEAAATLLYDERRGFQEADAAMGDPNP
jgi:hypothetical protein